MIVRQRSDSSATRENDMAPQAQTPEDESLRFNLGRAVLLLENALGRVPGGATGPTDPALSQELQDALDSVRQALRVPEGGSDTDLEDQIGRPSCRESVCKYV